MYLLYNPTSVFWWLYIRVRLPVSKFYIVWGMGTNIEVLAWYWQELYNIDIVLALALTPNAQRMGSVPAFMMSAVDTAASW